MTEICRRITLGIYDHDEYDKAYAWIKENCKEGFDVNAGKDLPEVITKSKVVDPDKDWEFITKMTLIVRDILFGNKKLDEMGWHEEALGKMQLPQASRDRETGQTGFLMQTLQSRLWLRHLTGTAKDAYSFATETIH